MSILAEAAHTMEGAAIAASLAYSTAEATVTLESDQAASGAMSMSAESVATMTGASVNASVLTATADASLTLYSSSSDLIVDAADFDGTNDYLTRGAALTGVADGKSGILSYWFNPEGGGITAVIFSNRNSAGTGSKILVLQNSDNTVTISCTRPADALTVLSGTTGAFNLNAWNHLLIAWDLAATTAQMYLNGVSTGSFSITTNDTIGYATSIANWSVGGNVTGGAKSNGGLAEFYFAANQYIDISVSTNREKFRSSGGKPVNLGVTGSTPTGSAPSVYLHLDDAETANNFAINRGTGGNFTVSGALSTFASSPSD